MIETPLRSFLASSSLSTSLYALTSGRVYIGGLPQNATYPAVVMFTISRVDGHNWDIPEDRIQFSCYADDYSNALALTDAISTMLKRFYQTLPTSTAYTIRHSVADNRAYLYDDNVLKHVSILDMLIQYRSI